MDKQGFTPQLRGTLFSALTGRGGDVSGRPDADVHGMLLAIGGPANTKSGIKVVAKSRQAATTKAGRRKAMAAVRQGPRARYGSKLSVTGQQGPLRSGTAYRRRRKITLDLAPAATEEMLAAYEDGGDKGYMAWLEGYASENYLDDWGFDSITDVAVDDPRSGL